MGNWKNEIARARFLINTTFGKLRFVEESHQYFLTQADGTEVAYRTSQNNGIRRPKKIGKIFGNDMRRSTEKPLIIGKRFGMRMQR